jgi:hypothetical protein
MVTRDWVEDLQLEFNLCTGLDPEQGSTQLIRLMRQHGVEFLKTSIYVTENSSTPKTLWYLVHIAHDLLQLDALTHPKYQKGRASLGFESESLSVRIYQSASFPNLSRVDPVALGLLAFGRLLYPDLHPIYGWIDEPSGNIPETSEIRLHPATIYLLGQLLGTSVRGAIWTGFPAGRAGLAGGGPGRWGHFVCHHRQLRGVVADGPLRAPGSRAPAIAKVAPRTARAAGRATSHPPGILPNTDPRHRALLGKGGTGLNGHAPGTRVERPSGKPFPFTRPRPRPGSLPPAGSHRARAGGSPGAQPVCVCLQQSNNPLRYTDPMGHCPWCIAAGIVLIVLKVLDYSWTALRLWPARWSMSRNRRIRRLRNHSMDSMIRVPQPLTECADCVIVEPARWAVHIILRQASSMAQPEHPRFTASDPGLDLLQRRAVSSHRFSTVSLKRAR